MNGPAVWLIGALAVAGIALALWWTRRRDRTSADALATIARGLRTTGETARPASSLPAGLLASGETPAVSARRRRAVPQRHAPYVPDAQLPPEVSTLGIFARGPHRFARNLLACAGERHELRVFDYAASETRADESAAVTVALFRSRVLHLPDSPFTTDAADARATIVGPLRERIERDHDLVVEGAGPWLAVYHREGLIPDDKLETFVEDAQKVHDLLAGLEAAEVER